MSREFQAALMVGVFTVATCFLPGCGPSEQEAQARGQLALSRTQNDKDLMIPDWYRARYIAWKDIAINQLFVNVTILSCILGFAFSKWYGASVGQCRNSRHYEFEAALKSIAIAVPVLCIVSYLVANMVVGMLHSKGDVPWDFCAFCVLIFFNLSLLFFGATYLLRKQKGQITNETSRNTLILSLGKALVVSILSGVASHIGGWMGGIAVMGILAVIGAVINPQSSS